MKRIARWFTCLLAPSSRLGAADRSSPLRKAAPSHAAAARARVGHRVSAFAGVTFTPNIAWIGIEGRAPNGRSDSIVTVFARFVMVT